jgi:hypothetical protein
VLNEPAGDNKKRHKTASDGQTHLPRFSKSERTSTTWVMDKLADSSRLPMLTWAKSCR